MQRNDVEMYRSICMKLADLNRHTVVTVSGSAEEFPYLQHPISVSGIPSSRINKKYRRKLRMQKARIEAFGRTLPPKQRNVFELRIIHGYSWKDVAKYADFNISPDGARVLYQRIFKKV